MEHGRQRVQGRNQSTGVCRYLATSLACTEPLLFDQA